VEVGLARAGWEEAARVGLLRLGDPGIRRHPPDHPGRIGVSHRVRIN
jgi:hypothetical protein